MKEVVPYNRRSLYSERLHQEPNTTKACVLFMIFLLSSNNMDIGLVSAHCGLHKDEQT